MKKKDPKLERAGVSGYNKPKRTPKHPTKKFLVVAKKGNKTKLIRFGDQKMTIKKISQPEENHLELDIGAILVLQIY